MEYETFGINPEYRPPREKLNGIYMVAFPCIYGDFISLESTMYI